VTLVRFEWLSMMRVKFLEDFLQSQRDDAWVLTLMDTASHCERLARCCLSIGEDSDVVAVEGSKD
jgi:hypothetical protein